jgi:hypothetical protein
MDPNDFVQWHRELGLKKNPRNPKFSASDTLATARRELLSGTVTSVGLDLEHLPDNFDGTYAHRHTHAAPFLLDVTVMGIYTHIHTHAAYFSL